MNNSRNGIKTQNYTVNISFPLVITFKLNAFFWNKWLHKFRIEHLSGKALGRYTQDP